ncbi:hypothetical protein C8Q73DRAFT_677066, partial [Cubamyces lactineus]
MPSAPRPPPTAMLLLLPYACTESTDRCAVCTLDAGRRVRNTRRSLHTYAWRRVWTPWQASGL